MKALHWPWPAGAGPTAASTGALLSTTPASQFWLLLALFCVTLSGLVLIEVPGSDHRSQLVFLLQALSLPLLPAFLHRLGDLRRVAVQRRLPGAIWPQILSRSLLRVAGGWILLSLPLLLAGPGLAGPAWLSLGLAAGLWAYAGWQGLATRAWLWLPALVLLLFGSVGLDACWQAWASAGVAAHLLGLSALPLSLYGLWSTVSATAPSASAPSAGQTTPATQMRAWLRRHRGRWRYLDGRSNSMMLIVVLPQLLPAMLDEHAHNAWLTPGWGQPLSPWHGPRLLFLALLCVGMLRSRELHWRWLLAPLGQFRRTLALKLARDSSLPMAAVCLMMLGFGWGGQVFIHHKPSLDSLLSSMALALPMLCDLSLALCLALLLRARFSSAQVSGGLACAAGIAALLIWIVAGSTPWQPGPGLMTRAWNSCLLTLGLSALLLAAAQQAWLRADLHDLLRSSQPKARPDQLD